MQKNSSHWNPKTLSILLRRLRNVGNSAFLAIEDDDIAELYLWCNSSEKSSSNGQSLELIKQDVRDNILTLCENGRAKAPERDALLSFLFDKRLKLERATISREWNRRCELFKLATNLIPVLHSTVEYLGRRDTQGVELLLKHCISIVQMNRSPSLDEDDLIQMIQQDTRILDNLEKSKFDLIIEFIFRPVKSIDDCHINAFVAQLEQACKISRSVGKLRKLHELLFILTGNFIEGCSASSSEVLENVSYPAVVKFFKVIQQLFFQLRVIDAQLGSGEGVKLNAMIFRQSLQSQEPITRGIIGPYKANCKIVMLLHLQKLLTTLSMSYGAVGNLQHLSMFVYMLMEHMQLSEHMGAIDLKENPLEAIDASYQLATFLLQQGFLTEAFHLFSWTACLYDRHSYKITKDDLTGISGLYANLEAGKLCLLFSRDKPVSNLVLRQLNKICLTLSSLDGTNIEHLAAVDYRQLCEEHLISAIVSAKSLATVLPEQETLTRDLNKVLVKSQEILDELKPENLGLNNCMIL